MLLGNLERRLFSLFKPGYVSKLEGNPRQKGSDGFQTSKYEDSQKNLAYPLLKDMFTLLGSMCLIERERGHML